MRFAILFTMVVACSKAAPPDPKQFATLSEDQQCEVTAPRGESCADEMLSAQLHSLAVADPSLRELETTMRKDLDRAPASNRDQRSALHRTMCQGERRYPEAIVTCWSIDNCNEFAHCVMTKLSSKK